MAVRNLTTGFAEQGHEVTVLALNTQKHYFNPQQLPPNVQATARFIAVDIDTAIRPLKAFLNLFTSQSYNIERFYSKQFENKLAELLDNEKFDLILLEGIYLMRYIEAIRKHSKAKVVLRLHNVEYIIWQRLRDAETNPLKKIYLGILAGRMKHFELAHINKADIAIALSKTDETIFVNNGCIIPHHSFPVGYVFDALPAISEQEESAVAFIGGMDWMPNREGVEWFISKVWPEILKQIPDAKFYLAGRNFPDELKNLNIKGITVLGEVENAGDFILSKSVFIVPLFAGSGIRVKIIEAMSLGRAIVSTSIGAEGLDYSDGENILIADHTSAFVNAIIKILQQKQLRIKLGNNAQKLVLEKYDNKKLSSAIIDYCKPYLN